MAKKNDELITIGLLAGAGVLGYYVYRRLRSTTPAAYLPRATVHYPPMGQVASGYPQLALPAPGTVYAGMPVALPVAQGLRRGASGMLESINPSTGEKFLASMV